MAGICATTILPRSRNLSPTVHRADETLSPPYAGTPIDKQHHAGNKILRRTPGRRAFATSRRCPSSAQRHLASRSASTSAPLFPFAGADNDRHRHVHQPGQDDVGADAVLRVSGRRTVRWRRSLLTRSPSRRHRIDSDRAIEEMLMMAPSCCARVIGITCLGGPDAAFQMIAARRRTLPPICRAVRRRRRTG